MFGRKVVAMRACMARWDEFVRQYPRVAHDIHAWCDDHRADKAYVLVTGYCVEGDAGDDPPIALEIRTENRKAARYVTRDQLELFRGNLVFTVLGELAKLLYYDACNLASEEG